MGTRGEVEARTGTGNGVWPLAVPGSMGCRVCCSDSGGGVNRWGEAVRVRGQGSGDSGQLMRVMDVMTDNCGADTATRVPKMKGFWGAVVWLSASHGCAAAACVSPTGE